MILIIRSCVLKPENKKPYTTQKENTLGRPWTASQAQSKRPPCCRKRKRPSKSAPPKKKHRHTKTTRFQIILNTKTFPNGPKTATWGFLGRLAVSWVCLGGSLGSLGLSGGARGPFLSRLGAVTDPLGDPKGLPTSSEHVSVGILRAQNSLRTDLTKRDKTAVK